MPERPHSMSRPLGAILLGAALALHAIALWRTHVLLAGDRPILGALLGVLALLVAVAGRGRGERTRWPALGGAVLVAAGAFAAPLLFARLPSAITPVVACALLALPALALGSLGMRSLPASILGGGLGAIGGALLLPFASPAGASLVAAALVAAGALLHRGSAPLHRAPGTAGPNALGLVAATLAGAVLAGAAFVVVGGGSHPWPARPAQAGFLLLGVALGLVVARRASGSALTGALAAGGIVLSAIMILPANDVVDRVVARLAVSPSHPAVGVAGGLLTLLAGAALAGSIAGFGAGLAAAFGARRALGLGLAAAAFVAVALVAAHASRAELAEISAEPPSRARYGLIDGHVVAWDAADRLPDDLFGAHAGALLATGRGRALVLGWGSPRTLEALALHGFTSVAEAGPAAPKAPGLDAGGRAAPTILVRGRDDIARLGSCDLIVSNLEDPTLPANEAFFTPAAQQAIRKLLLPGGVFVQRLSLDRLGPEGLTRHVMLLRETFPATWLATSDLGRGGSVFAICLGPPTRTTEAAPPVPEAANPRATAATAPHGPDASTDPSLAANPELGAPRPGVPVAPAPDASAGPDHDAIPALPARLLTAAGRLSPEVGLSLRRARLLDAEQLLATFAAGPAEIAALGAGLGSHDPWLPGSLAFRHPAPADVARDLAQAMLYGRLSYVDVAFEPTPRAGDGTHPEKWDLLGMESRLGPSWTGESAVIRHANHLGRLFGHPAVSRDEARRLVLESAGRRLEIRRRRAADAPRQVLAAALADLEGKSLSRSGGAVVHGHEALWMLEQEGVGRQEVTLAWYCPAQGSLYTAELVLTGADVRPGLYEEPLRLLTDDIRCRHPQPPSAPPAEAAAAPPAPGAEAPRP